jgi:hypothetical protein
MCCYILRLLIGIIIMRRWRLKPATVVHNAGWPFGNHRRFCGCCEVDWIQNNIIDSNPIDRWAWQNDHETTRSGFVQKAWVNNTRCFSPKTDPSSGRIREAVKISLSSVHTSMAGHELTFTGGIRFTYGFPFRLSWSFCFFVMLKNLSALCVTVTSTNRSCFSWIDFIRFDQETSQKKEILPQTVEAFDQNSDHVRYSFLSIAVDLPSNFVLSLFASFSVF